MRSPRPQRGISLVELVVAMAVSAIVLVAALAAAQAQQRAYYDGQRTREAQGSARNALLFVEEKLSSAGFGMDPAHALDLGWYSANGTSRCPSEMGTCPRDSTSNSDELVFYARNPSYWVPSDATQSFHGRAWQIVTLDVPNDKITVSARPGDFFPKGRILQLVCDGGSRYAYVTIATTVKLQATDPAQDLELALEPAGATIDPFHGQTLATNACFASTSGTRPRAYELDRYRFHVRPVDVGTGVPDPFLVLDTGADENGDGELTPDDESILAEGVETMQVSYWFENAALGQAGATAGTALTISEGTASTATTTANAITRTKFPGPAPATTDPSEFVYARSSFMDYALDATERTTNHQANVRAIRVALFARSASADAQRTVISPLATGWTLLNLDANPTWIGNIRGYERVSLDATVAVPNLASRRFLDQ